MAAAHDGFLEGRPERTLHSAPHVLPGRAFTHGPWGPQVMTEAEGRSGVQGVGRWRA
jgi:hypothetical protein